MGIWLAFLLLVFPLFFLILKKRRSSKRLPPGSLGLPVIGQSLNLLRALRANTAVEWLEERANKYGPISKLSLFGKPTVFIYGQAANKFVFTSDNSILTNQQPNSLRKILGDQNLLELSGYDHKRIRDSLVSFLKPDSLKMYVSKMEEEVRTHLQIHWKSKEVVEVLPLMKTLTFNMICSFIFGLESGARREQFISCFKKMVEGMWSLPINLPFTRYNKGLKASAKVMNMLKDLIQEKRYELEHNRSSSHQDLITCLLSIHGEDSKELISETEIIHNVALIMAAGYDTSSKLITSIIRILANDPVIYEAVLKEQEEIAESKSSGECLTWEDLGKMKFTWKVAMETLRMFPPIFGGFRKTAKDIEFGGYHIPKGWQIFWVTAMTHMDSSIFQEPEKFNPSRFDNQATLPSYCFIPFGGGHRICPGYDFAKIETLVTIHLIITHFTWKLSCQNDYFNRDAMAVPTEDLPIHVKPKRPL